MLSLPLTNHRSHHNPGFPTADGAFGKVIFRKDKISLEMAPSRSEKHVFDRDDQRRSRDEPVGLQILGGERERLVCVLVRRDGDGLRRQTTPTKPQLQE